MLNFSFPHSPRIKDKAGFSVEQLPHLIGTVCIRLGRYKVSRSHQGLSWARRSIMKCVFQLFIVYTFFKAVYTSRIYRNSCFGHMCP